LQVFQVYFISEEPDEEPTELFLRVIPFIMLLVGIVGEKKRIVDEDGGEIGQSSTTGRMVFHILFML